MTKTPRTDAAVFIAGGCCSSKTEAVVEADFARQLEEENDRIKATLREYLALSSIDGKAERQPLRKLLASLIEPSL